MTKIGFLYHFSVHLPGLGGLAAWLVQEIEQLPAQKRALALSSWSAYAFSFPLRACPALQMSPMTLQMIGRFPEQGWPDEWAEKSNPLMAARKSGKRCRLGGTLSASAFSFYLPAAGAAPENGAAWRGLRVERPEQVLMRQAGP